MPTRGKTEKTHLLSRCRFPGDGYRGSEEALQLKSTSSLASPPSAIRKLPSIRPVWRTRAISFVVFIPSTSCVAVSKSSSRNTCQVGGNSIASLRSACGGEVTVPGAYSRGFFEFRSRIFYMYASRFVRALRPGFAFFTSV
jgi:hypothetical protein